MAFATWTHRFIQVRLRYGDVRPHVSTKNTDGICNTVASPARADLQSVRLRLQDNVHTDYN